MKEPLFYGWRLAAFLIIVMLAVAVAMVLAITGFGL